MQRLAIRHVGARSSLGPSDGDGKQLIGSLTPDIQDRPEHQAQED